MMTIADMIRAADRARHEGRHQEAEQWTSLYRIIDRIEAAARLAVRRPDDLQWDYEREAQAQGVHLRSLLR